MHSAANTSLPLFDRATASGFEEYDRQNPQVYAMFKRFAFEAIRAGRTRMGAKMIAERIRWETVVSGNDGFKINNNIVAGLARRFAQDYPQYADRFETRKSKFDEVIS